MKHLKQFETEAEYTQFKDTEYFILPNVSYVEETNVVMFNPDVELGNPNVVCTYNVTDISQKTQTLNYYHGLECFSSMIVDGVEMDADKYYQFDTIGNHVIEYILIDPTIIGEQAFDSCTSLTSITIPNSVTSIERYAFNGCTSLTSITIGNGVTIIGERAFWDCRSLTSITIPNSVNSIGDEAFSACRSLTSITIPDSVNSIEYKTFEYCSSLTSVTIPNSVTSIGEKAFQGCNSLTSITIPDSVTTIGDYAFRYCSGLTSITIPNSVNSIGEYAFGDCTSLTNVTIGNGVNSIKNYAFRDCSSLTSITCHATTAPSILSSTFLKVSNGGTLYVPTGSDYSSWMSTDMRYLGYYNWTIEYI